MNTNSVTIDGIKWWVRIDEFGNRHPQPLCTIHKLRLRPIDDFFSNQYNFGNLSRTLKCQDCKEAYKIPRSYQSELLYVVDKLDAKVFGRMKFINFDDEAIPIAIDKIPKNSEYFVTSLLTKSKIGLRLVVYAGKRGSDSKTQLFVEPEIKRLAFDQKDLHPTDVFTMVEATFEDGTKAKIQKGVKK